MPSFPQIFHHVLQMEEALRELGSSPVLCDSEDYASVLLSVFSWSLYQSASLCILPPSLCFQSHHLELVPEGTAGGWRVRWPLMEGCFVCVPLPCHVISHTVQQRRQNGSHFLLYGYCSRFCQKLTLSVS